MFGEKSYTLIQEESNYTLLDHREMSHEALTDEDYDRASPDPKETIVGLTDDMIYLAVRKTCRSIDYFYHIRYVARTLLDLFAIFGIIGFIVAVS